jgi:hypothetical protein
MKIIDKKNTHVPPMTAQHFFYIARTIQQFVDRPSKKVVIEAFADRLEATNPNFRRDLFVSVSEGKQP